MQSIPSGTHKLSLEKTYMKAFHSNFFGLLLMIPIIILYGDISGTISYYQSHPDTLIEQLVWTILHSRYAFTFSDHLSNGTLRHNHRLTSHQNFRLNNRNCNWIRPKTGGSFSFFLCLSRQTNHFIASCGRFCVFRRCFWEAVYQIEKEGGETTASQIILIVIIMFIWQYNFIE